MKMKCDFSGWATKYNVKCSDGRTIMHGAFEDQNGKKVPLVWQHVHDNIENVLGHAILESRKDGMYAYCFLNNSDAGQMAREAIAHGDVDQLSVFANKLTQKHDGRVMHGNIREISLVLAGANPEAIIENMSLEHSADGEVMEMVIFPEEPLSLSHGDEDDQNDDDEPDKDNIDDDQNDDDDDDDDDDEDDNNVAHSDDNTYDAILRSMTDEQYKVTQMLVAKALEHADTNKDAIVHSDDATVADVLKTFNEDQMKVLHYLIALAMDKNNSDEVQHSGIEEDEDMKKNVFEGRDDQMNDVLSQDAINEILSDAKGGKGSLRDATKSFFLAHSGDYGIDHIEYLFPDYRNVQNTPEFIKRDDTWVDIVMRGVHHVPFSRIKTVFADITEDEARAKGYTKGGLKIEEVFDLLKRTTDPQTVYKKQKLDRDDIVDITDFDVVAWIKTEMRMMLNEELARAFLIGDGRSSISRDKIKTEHIRPIWQDNGLFTINAVCNFNTAMKDDEKCDLFITKCVKARKNYKGSGNPKMFITEDRLADLLLMKDGIGHRIYKTVTELATALRVSEIVSVPVMEGQTRTFDGTTYTLEAIIVNLNDYNVGADKGGAISMFEDFDIDFNQEKYLIETRCSATLVKPYSAITIESTTTQAAA